MFFFNADNWDRFYFLLLSLGWGPPIRVFALLVRPLPQTVPPPPSLFSMREKQDYMPHLLPRNFERKEEDGEEREEEEGEERVCER